MLSLLRRSFFAKSYPIVISSYTSLCWWRKAHLLSTGSMDKLWPFCRYWIRARHWWHQTTSGYIHQNTCEWFQSSDWRHFFWNIWHHLPLSSKGETQQKIEYKAPETSICKQKAYRSWLQKFNYVSTYCVTACVFLQQGRSRRTFALGSTEAPHCLPQGTPNALAPLHSWCRRHWLALRLRRQRLACTEIRRRSDIPVESDHGLLAGPGGPNISQPQP